MHATKNTHTAVCTTLTVTRATIESDFVFMERIILRRVFLYRDAGP